MDEGSWPTVRQLGNHWHWRPEWHEDRTCLLWYLTFEDQPQVAERAEQLEGALLIGDTIDVVPRQWLHLTLADVAYVDEVSPDQVETVARTTREAVSECLMPPLELGPVVAMSSAVVLQARPRSALSQLRDRLRAVSTAVLGRVEEPPIREFWPHVSVGYVNDQCAGHSVMEPFGPVVTDPVPASASRLTLAAVTRRDRHYQWAARAVLPLATRPRGSAVTETGESRAL